MRNSNEPTEWMYCSAKINVKVLELLAGSKAQLEELSLEALNYSRHLVFAAKLEAVMRAVGRVYIKLFPRKDDSSLSDYYSCTLFGGFYKEEATGPVRRTVFVQGSSLGVCGAQIPSYTTSHGRWSAKSCTKPLVEYSLCPVFEALLLELAEAQKDSHMEHVMTNVLGVALSPKKAWLAANVSPLVTANEEVLSEVVQEVEHPEEVAAERDETLLQAQADHDWADAVSDRIQRGVIGEDVGVEEATERVFLFP